MRNVVYRFGTRHKRNFALHTYCAVMWIYDYDLKKHSIKKDYKKYQKEILE
jgi:hypothetical protein